jgi:hypothetical protein
MGIGSFIGRQTAKKVVKKVVPTDKVKLGKKFVNMEQRIINKVDKQQPVTEKQVLEFSKAIKLNQKAKVMGKNFEEGNNYVTKKQFNNTKGSIKHGLNELDELGYFPMKTNKFLKGLGYGPMTKKSQKDIKKITSNKKKKK